MILNRYSDSPHIWSNSCEQTMIDLTLERPDGLACVYPDELIRGKKIIHLGTQTHMTAADALRYGVDLSDPNEWHERECEIIISHETMHISLWGLEGSYVCRKYDNIDTFGRLHREILVVDKQ